MYYSALNYRDHTVLPATHTHEPYLPLHSSRNPQGVTALHLADTHCAYPQKMARLS